MTTCPDCGCHLHRLVTYSYDEETMRQYQCAGCGQAIATREEIAATVRYTQFRRPTYDGVPMVITRAATMCREVQGLSRKDFLRMAEDVLRGRKRLLIVPAEKS